MNTPRPLHIADLEARTGVSRRTVHFYVQRGLVAPPEGAGRGAFYTEAHVEQVLRVRRLQREGVPLDRMPDPAVAPSAPRALEAVWRVALAPGVVLEISAAACPSVEVAHAWAERCAEVLQRAPTGAQGGQDA